MGEALGCVSRDDEEEGKAQAKDVSLDQLDVFKEDAGGADSQDSPHFGGTASVVPPLSLSRPGRGIASRGMGSSSRPQTSSGRSLGLEDKLGVSTSVLVAEARQNANTVLLRLRTGNSQFTGSSRPDQAAGLARAPDCITGPCCLIVLVHTLPLPVECLFAMSDGELVVANCSRHFGAKKLMLDDGGASAAEHAMFAYDVPYILVLGSLWPNGKTQKAVDEVWEGVSELLRVSGVMRDKVRKGLVTLDGAVLEIKTGEVRFLGQHKKQDQLIQTANQSAKDFNVETTPRGGKAIPLPAVPCAEALAILKCGNARACINKEALNEGPGSARSLGTSRALGPPGSARSMGLNSARREQPKAYKASSYGYSGDGSIQHDGSTSSIITRSQFMNSTALKQKRRQMANVTPGLGPIAVVFMDYDPHKDEGPLAEHLFDVHSSMVATVKTTGEDQSSEAWTAHATVAEHCLKENGTRVILVLGRATDPSEEARVKEQVMNSIPYLFECGVIRCGVMTGMVELQGAMFLGSSGEGGIVKWLGCHPDQSALVGDSNATFMKKYEQPQGMLQFHSATPAGRERTVLNAKEETPDERAERYKGGDTFAVSEARIKRQFEGELAESVQSVIEIFAEGNKRYLRGDQTAAKTWTCERLAQAPPDNKDALAVILCGACWEARHPMLLFDAEIGRIISHRSPGVTAGRTNIGGALGMLEDHLRNRGDAKLLLILEDVRDPLGVAAAQQCQNLTQAPRWGTNAQIALEEVLPTAFEAVKRVNPPAGDIEGEKQQEVVRETLKINVFYQMERILRGSDYISGLIADGQLAMHGALVMEDGSVDFLGLHPGLARLLYHRTAAERHRKKGLMVGEFQ